MAATASPSPSSSAMAMPPMIMPMMPMTFWQGQHLQVLWTWWNITTPAQYAGSVIIVILLCILHRFFSFMVGRRSKAPYSSQSSTERLLGDAGRPKIPREKVPKAKLVLRSLEVGVYQTLSFALAYLIMLVAMTFNVGMFIAVIVGESLGYFGFDIVDRFHAEETLAARLEDDCCT
jgi:solute carrier family 31 (copper transporter), member 1